MYDLSFGRRRTLGNSMSPALDVVAGGWTYRDHFIRYRGTRVPQCSATAASTNITHRPNRTCDGNDSSLLHNLRTNGLLGFDTSCFVT